MTYVFLRAPAFVGGFEVFLAGARAVSVGVPFGSGS